MTFEVICTEKNEILRSTEIFYIVKLQSISDFNCLTNSYDQSDLTITTKDPNQFLVGKTYIVQLIQEN